MKAFVAAFLLTFSTLALSADAPAAPAVQPTFTGVVIVALDHKPTVLMFIWSNGAAPLALSVKDCADSPECKATFDHLAELKHVKLLDLATNTKV